MTGYGRASRLPAVLACAGLAAMACAQVPPPAGTATQAVPEVPPVDGVAFALAQGARAERIGREGAGELLEASRLLAAYGARPAQDAQPDLGRRWRELAHSRGAAAVIPPYRGRTLGPAYRRGQIGPGEMTALEQTFLAGQRAEVALMPNGPSPLVLEVSEPGGRPLCSQRAQDPPAKCTWLPVYTARHSIVVRNEGRAAADYFLVVN